MAIRIVHFGEDTFNRISTLKSNGYSVDECYSLSELHASLVGILPADAVTIAENDRDGAVTDHAISLTRSISAAPLILFRGGNQRYSAPEIDLVVPSNAGADDWLKDLAKLIERSSGRDA